MKKWLFVLPLVVALAAIGIWRLSASNAHTAPDVSFTSLEGKTVNMQQLRGKVVLIKFWATSCVTCVAQMPDMISNYREFHDQGFETLAVAMRYDPPNYVKTFADTRQLPFPVVIDAMGELAQAFGGVQLTPTAFLIDKQGNIIKRYLGEYDKSAFQATLRKALAG